VINIEKSFKFKNIEVNLVKLLDLLLDNSNFRKYIYHLADNPLNQSEVSIDLLESGNIVLAPFDEDILDQQRVTIFINPLEGDLRKQPLSSLTFLVDIVVPNSKWLLRDLGEIRAFRIADEISQLVDQKNVLGIGETEISKFRIYKVGKSYSGLSLWITVSSSTMKGLR
jgi:hypothetical protein